MTDTRSNTTTRHFCPLVLYHDSPTDTLVAQNKQRHMLIDRHRIKTEAMLKHNAQLWSAASFHDMPDDYRGGSDDSNSIDVSPSTSTSSSSSASTSSSSDHSYSNVDQRPTMPVTVMCTSPQTNAQGLLSPGFSVPQGALSKAMYDPASVKATAPLPDPIKKRRRGNLPKEVTEYLKSWLVDHKKHPYPSEKEKAQLAAHTSLTVNQISNWFINARRRILQPMLESENNAHLLAYSEMAAIEQKKQRQLDIYTYQGFADAFQDDSQKWAIRRTKIPPFDAIASSHHSLAMR